MDAVGALIAAVAVAATFFSSNGRVRAVTALLALALVPVLLASELWDTAAFHTLRSHAGPALFAVALGVMAMAGLAALFDRRPQLFPPLAVAALPFRIPVDTGADTANLLIPLYFVIGAGVMAYAWSYFKGTRTGREAGPGAPEAVLLLAVVLYAVQATYTGAFEVALKNMAFFYIPFALLLRLLTTVRWTRETIRNCLLTVLGLALLFAAVGFGEFATRHLLLNPKVIAQNQASDFFRVNSLFFDPSIYGRFLALVMLLVVAAMLWARSRRTVVLSALALAVLWAALLTSFSQSSFAALLVGCAVLAGLRWSWKPVIATAVVGALAAVAIVVAAPGIVHLDTKKSGDVEKATSSRGSLVSGGLGLFGERPLQGYGSGSFNVRFRDREDATFEQAAAASHTSPITVAAEQGAIGLVVYILLLVASFAMLFRGVSELRRPRQAPAPEVVARGALAACFAALVIHTWVYAAFLEDPLTWTLIGASIGISAAYAAQRERPASPSAGQSEPLDR
jgi:hypothetical protein